MKLIKILIIGMLFAAGCAEAQTATNLPKPEKTPAEKLDTIVAVVNNEIITQSQLDKEVDIVKMQLQAMNAPVPSDKELDKQVLNKMIDKGLILQLAKRNNIKATDTQVDRALSDVAKRNNLSMDQLKQALAEQGMNFNTYRQQVRDQIVMAEMRQHVIGPTKLTVSDQEANEYLRTHGAQGTKEYDIQDILVPLPANATAAQVKETQGEANKILSELRKGTSFDQLASGRSSGEQLQSSDLGWRSAAQLPDLFAKTVTNMQAGQFGGPVTAPNGFHIIKLLDVRTAGAKQMDLADAKQAVYQEKIDAKLKPWVTQLRNTAYVKVFIN